ncbi:MAG TPA: RHS repeat-associated core domain-containing protein [Novosphingobium sp.]|nr:RHS repeat-associated core domain-containing protein [Novosphingobium sp.]
MRQPETSSHPTDSTSANGRLQSVNGPPPPDAQNNDDLTSYAYAAQGNLQTLTNALGQITSFAGHDGNGRPTTVTDPNGVVTALTYDGMGRIATMTAKHPTDTAQDAVTTFGYDAVGQLTSLTLPSTETLLMDYDAAGRLVTLRAANGERRDFVYDAMGNVVSETDKRADTSLARQITRTFDELGRIIAQTTGTGSTARWSYDKVGNPVSATSPNGHATTAAFDALDRVVSTVAPDSGTTALTYDQRDGLTAFTDPKTVTTQFVRNGFGEVIQEVSPDRGTSTYWYDAAGQLTQSSDGRGQIIAYTRDLLGRVTSKVPQGRPTSEAVTYTWDSGGLAGSYGIGRLGKVEDGTGTTQFRYDHRGNLLAKQQAIGTSGSAQLAYTYDLADRITQIVYPSGREVAYGYDAKGRVSSVQTRASGVSTWTTVSSGYAYKPFGAVRQVALGNGLAVANDWGGDGRLASRRLYRTSDATSLSWLAYGYDADDNIASITNQLSTSGSSLYGYDSMGRLSLTVVDAASLGNESYAYAPGTNRLAAVASAAGTRSVTYDARGNTASETRPGAIAATTAYDGYGRLTGYTRTDSGVMAFAYNGLDDRVIMTLPAAGTRRFVYDASGRVLGEYGASASDVKAEFIWALPEVANDNPWGGDDGLGGYMPLAVATPDSTGAIQLNWVHANHLGVPLVTTDTSGTPATTPNDYFAPGFPGQSRVLPDLYYNRYRDYDPATGRYVQADPIGLEGGSNPYGYALGNPVNLTDPTGEFVPIIIGMLIGLDLSLIDQVWWQGRRGRCIDWRAVGIETAFGAFGGELWSPALKLTRGSMKFANVSRRIRRAEGLINEPIDLHHGILPRRFERLAPWAEKIVNHPANLRPVARPLHRLMHGDNPFLRWHGLPTWAQAAAISAATGAGAETMDGD